MLVQSASYRTYTARHPAAAVQMLRPWAMHERARLLLCVAGFVPIVCLSAALVGVAPLYWTLRLLILPAAAFALVMGVRAPAAGRLALVGLLAGMVATGVYDLARLGLIASGVWHDFIPSIGRLAFNDPHASPLWGYGYRYLFDGGAMAMTFTLVPGRKSAGTGLVFGVLICMGLFATLLVSPEAQQLTFRLTPVTAAAALAGHTVYGLVLGTLLHRTVPAE